jgi:hypothetical protein
LAGETEILGENLPSATLSATNPTLNPGHCGGNPVTNCLSYGVALLSMYWGVEVVLHTFLTLAIDQGEWSASWPCCFNAQKTACGKHHEGHWVGSTAGLHGTEKRKISCPCLEFEPCPGQSLVIVATVQSQLPKLGIMSILIRTAAEV